MFKSTFLAFALIGMAGGCNAASLCSESAETVNELLVEHYGLDKLLDKDPEDLADLFTNSNIVTEGKRGNKTVCALSLSLDQSKVKEYGLDTLLSDKNFEAKLKARFGNGNGSQDPNKLMDGMKTMMSVMTVPMMIASFNAQGSIRIKYTSVETDDGDSYYVEIPNPPNLGF